MNESFMEVKRNYNSIELKPTFSIGMDDPVSAKGRTFADSVYSDDKVPFSSSARKGSFNYTGLFGLQKTTFRRRKGLGSRLVHCYDITCGHLTSVNYDYRVVI